MKCQLNRIQTYLIYFFLQIGNVSISCLQKYCNVKSTAITPVTASLLLWIPLLLKLKEKSNRILENYQKPLLKKLNIHLLILYFLLTWLVYNKNVELRCQFIGWNRISWKYIFFYFFPDFSEMCLNATYFRLLTFPYRQYDLWLPHNQHHQHLNMAMIPLCHQHAPQQT